MKHPKGKSTYIFILVRMCYQKLSCDWHFHCTHYTIMLCVSSVYGFVM